MGLNPKTALRWVAALLAVSTALLTWPLVPVVVLAAWVSELTRPLFARITRLTRGRQRAASAMVVLLVVLLLVPVSGVSVSLGLAAVDLVNRVSKSPTARNALDALVNPGAPTGLGEAAAPDEEHAFHIPTDPQGLIAAAQRYGAQAINVLGSIAGAAARGVIALFIFFAAVFTFLTDGPAIWRWLQEHAPLAPRHVERLGAAFHETGRGLLIGVGLTSLAQGVVATVAYVALGVPRALVLGLLTGVCSLVPAVGTAIVWVPIAIGLAVNGQPVRAVVLGAIGLLGIGSIDNVLRPWFAKMGRLQMPIFLLFLAIFGGLATLGAWGAMLGPLVVRLCMEALELLKAERQEPTAN